MRHILLFFLLFWFADTAWAQFPSSTCEGANAVYRITQIRNAMQQSVSNQSRLEKARNFLRSNCVSVSQVRSLAQTFTDDYDRMQFALEAFDRVTNPDEFYDVYDSFEHLSIVMRLHDAIKSGESSTRPGQASNPDNPRDQPGAPNLPPDSRFPDWNYPDYRYYQGNTRCSGIMSEDAFNRLVRDVQEESLEVDRINQLQDAAGDPCFAVAQVMRLGSLLNQEENRLAWVKMSMSNLFDIQNSNAFYQMIPSSGGKSMLRRILSKGSPGQPGRWENTHCAIPASEFEEIKTRIKQTSFDDNKANLFKTIVESKGCIGADQVRQIVSLFSFSKTQLSVAKWAYDYCHDRDNYYKVGDGLRFSSDRDKLLNYIRERRSSSTQDR